MKDLLIKDRKCRVVIIGMGYVGLTYALHINSLGYSVLGIENNKKIKKDINNCIPPFFEEGIESQLNKSISNQLLNVILPEEYIQDKTFLNTFIITVGTPVNNKIIDKSSLNTVFDFLKNNINENDAISLRSTVPIGFTSNYCNSLPKKIKYSFAPERTIEGKASYELANLPQVFGSNDKASKIFFNDFFNKLSSEVVNVSSTDTAEMVKLVSNVYRDVIFGFSNEISLIAYNNNIKSSEVINACNYKYDRCNIFSSGPVAGPCLSKDSYILSPSINENKNKSIILSSRDLNEKYIINIISGLLSNVKNAAILGLSFKGSPPTSDIRDSYALEILSYLRKNNIDVSAFDPLVFDEDFLKHKIKRETTLESAFTEKDLIIIQNNNEIFKRMDLIKLSSLLNKNSIIIDLWSLHKNIEIKNSEYIAL